MSISQSITRALGKNKLRLRKNSPHILFGAGVVGVVGATVLACRATLKLEKTIEGVQHDVNGARDERIDDRRSSRQVHKDIAYAYVKGGAELARLYAPAIIVGGTSIGLLTGSHVQLTRRNATLTLAYSGLHQAYTEYRERVRAELGEDKERELHFGTVTEELVDEKGKLQTVKSIDPNQFSVYARFFDESNPNWNRDSELNRLFIQCQQNYANHRLQAIGHLFLNEVYDMLGMERSQAGQVVGWAVGVGDPYVDFGLFECDSSRFINNIERSILLDFNVAGTILDKI